MNKRLIRVLGVLVCALSLLACALPGLATGLPETAAALSLEAAHITMENRTAGTSNVLLPTLNGHPDAEIQQAINEDIAQRLHVEEALRTLERVSLWGDEDGQGSGIHMDARAYVADTVLSLVVSVRGEQYDGSLGHSYVACNYDLLTGQALVLADLLVNPEEAFDAMEDIIARTLQEEGLNAYLEFADIVPMPRDAFSLDARGLMVYYPATQYSLLDGTSGAFFFPFYQVEAFMADTPLCEQLLARRAMPEDPAEQVRRDTLAGKLPGVSAQIGEAMLDYIETYTLLAEPDYTLDGPLYQFASPLMQGVRLGGEMYPEEGAFGEENLGSVVSIRSSLVDLYGLRPGVSTLQDVHNMLGEPDDVTRTNESLAEDMLLVPGESYWYDAEDNRLEFHADEAGVLRVVILHTHFVGAY